MKTLKSVSLAALLLPLSLVAPAAAQTTGSARDANTNAYVELLKGGDVDGQWEAVVTEILQLSPDHANVFWPIHREYMKELRALNAAGVAALQAYARDYQQVSDARADELLNTFFRVERQRIDLKQKYYDRMKAAISAATAARYFEVDRQLQSIADLQATAVLPAGAQDSVMVPQASSAQAPGKVTVPAGTRLLIRTMESVDTGRSRAGALFTAELETNLKVGSDVVAPAGTVVHGRVANVSGAGRAVGRSDLQLELVDIVVNGTAFPIVSTDYSVVGARAATDTAGRMLRGVGLGAAVGAFNSNAARGAGIGATAAAAGSVATRGEQINIPRGTMLEFRLQQPASLPRQ